MGTERQTDGQTDRQTDGRTDGQTQVTTITLRPKRPRVKKMNLWVQFHRSKFLMVQLTLYVWFRQCLSNRLVTSHYLNRWWQDFCRHMVSPGLSELTHYGQSLWCQMATQIWVNTGSGNGSFLDGSKPVPESVFTNYQWGIVAFNLSVRKSDQAL